MPLPGLSQSLAAIWACLLLAEADAPASAIPLAFSPVKLILLLAWVYLCLYLVQRVDDSPLVPSRYKSILYVVTLFAGPFVFLVLVLSDTKKSAQQGSPFVDIVQRLRDAVLRIWHSGAARGRRRYHAAAVRFDGHRAERDLRSRREPGGRPARSGIDRPRSSTTPCSSGPATSSSTRKTSCPTPSGSASTARCRVVRDLSAETCRAVINSIKAVSSMDISERRRPQDGAFTARKGETTFSFRVASAGALNGEKLSVRVLNTNAGQFTLADAGIPERQRAVIQSAVSKPSGMVLICGPTGSGKTTTLYAMLNQIDRFTHNVITVEDPDRSLSAGGQPDRDQRQGRHHVRQDAAQHPPPGPRRDLRGRNTRRGNGRDRPPRGTDRPPGAGHHSLRQQRHGPDPAAGLGSLAHAAVVGIEPAGFATADPQTLRSVQEAGPAQHHAGPGIPPKRHRHEKHVPARGLRTVRRNRLLWTGGHLRPAGHHRPTADRDCQQRRRLPPS